MGVLGGLNILSNAIRLGVPKVYIIKMLINISIDVSIGMIPWFGAIFDLFFKANKRNVKVMQEYLAELKAKEQNILKQYAI